MCVYTMSTLIYIHHNNTQITTNFTMIKRYYWWQNGSVDFQNGNINDVRTAKQPSKNMEITQISKAIDCYRHQGELKRCQCMVEKLGTPIITIIFFTILGGALAPCAPPLNTPVIPLMPATGFASGHHWEIYSDLFWLALAMFCPDRQNV